MSRIPDPQFSFADLELRRQGVHLDSTLQGIDDFLEDHSALVEQVRQDLERGLKSVCGSVPESPAPGETGSPRHRPCARWSSCASRTGIIAN